MLLVLLCRGEAEHLCAPFARHRLSHRPLWLREGREVIDLYYYWDDGSYGKDKITNLITALIRVENYGKDGLASGKRLFNKVQII